MPKTREESFKILKLPESASEEEVKKAYKQKARELHPDKNPDDPLATRKFQELGEAYQLITSGKCDGDELPDDFFMDPFELFLKVMLIRRMREQQARRRFAQAFGGLFFEEDDDDDDDLGFGIPFAAFSPYGGFTFATRSNSYGQRSSSPRYRKSRAENQRTGHNNRPGAQNRQNRKSGQNHEKNGSWSRTDSQNDARKNYTRNSEQSCNSEKTKKEAKCSKETGEGKENVDENFPKGRGSSQNGEASFDIKVKGARPKKKTQQTSASWKKGKKGNKGGRRRPPQVGSFKSWPTGSAGQFGGNTHEAEKTCQAEREDLQERENCSNCGNVQEPRRYSNDESARSKEAISTKDDIEDFARISVDNCSSTSSKVFTDKMSKAESTESAVDRASWDFHPDKDHEAQPSTNQVQATVEQNVISALDKKLKDSTECTTKFEETSGIANEEKLNQVEEDKCELKEKQEISKSEAESKKCSTGEACAELAQNGARPKSKNEQSNTGIGGGKGANPGRNWQPRKGGKRKKYVNTKFQNMDQVIADSKVSETVPKGSVASSDKSEERHLVSGKGFTWNKKTQEQECKEKSKKRNTKLKESTKPNQMKSEETEGKMHSSEAPCSEDSAISDRSRHFSQCKPQEYQKRSVDELYGNMKCKKSKGDTRKQNQSGGQYYFGKSYASNFGEGSAGGLRTAFSDEQYSNQDRIVTSSSSYSQKYYPSNQGFGATRPCASHAEASARQECYFQPNNISCNGGFASSNVIKNIQVENYQSNNQNQSWQDFSLKSGQQRTLNQTTNSWMQRESQCQQLYNMMPKNEQEEQRQLEIALALSQKQAV